MPEYVREALEHAGLGRAYEDRPPYQRNDYIGWISRAAGEETRRGRVEQMLSELAQGDVYMRTAWRPAQVARGDQPPVEQDEGS